MVPGELENGLCQERTQKGIVLPEGTTSRLEVVAKRFGIVTPW
jgi:hypothetical protein